MNYQTCICIAIFLILGVCLCNAASTATCQIWTGQPTECQNFMNITDGMSWFIPPGYEPVDMIYNLQYALQLIKSTLGSKYWQCAQWGLRSICLTWLRGCVETPDGAFPIEPCMNVFDMAYAGCFPPALAAGLPNSFGFGNYLPKGMKLPMRSNYTDVDNGGGPFWSSYSHTSSDNTTIYIPCNSGGPDKNVTMTICDDPLAEHDGSCGFDCPLPPASRDDWYAIETIIAVVGMPAMVLSGLVLGFLLANPISRKFPDCMYIFVALWCLVLSVAGVYALLTGNRYEEIWCEGNTYLRAFFTQSRTGAAFYLDLVGFVSGGHECSMTGAMYWMGLLGLLQAYAHILTYQIIRISTANHWIRETSDKLRETRALSWAGHKTNVTLNIGIQSLGCIALAIVAGSLWASGQFKFGVGSTFCFIDPNSKGVLTAFWIIPMFALLVYIILGSIVSLCAIIGASINLGSSSWLAFAVPFAFTSILGVVYIICYIGVTIFSLYFLDNHEAVETSTSNTFQCKINQASPACQDTGDTATHIGLMYLQTIVVALLPLLIMTVFIARPKFWTGNYQFARSLARVRSVKQLVDVVGTANSQRSDTLSDESMSVYPVPDDPKSETDESTSEE